MASGLYFNNIFKPFMLNPLGAPVRLRVPSGNITADLFSAAMYLAKLINAGMDCLGFFRSINTEPPCFRLKEMLGKPLPNSILETNLG